MTPTRLVAVFGASTTEPGTEAWAEAETVGRLCGEAGLGVVTGGYGGTMEAVSAGAAGTGALVVGVTAPGLFRTRPGANPHVTEEKIAQTIPQRIEAMTDMATGAIALPGAVGTATELLICWNNNQISRHHGGRRIPTAAVGSTWERLVSHLAEETDGLNGDVEIATDATAAVNWLLAQPEFH